MTNKPVDDCPVVTVGFADAAFPSTGELSFLDTPECFGERLVGQPNRGSECLDGLAVTGAGL